MALYVDSALIDDITNLVKTIPLSGATTNPSILLAARMQGQQLSPEAILNELLRILHGDIFMQPGAIDAEGMHQQALEYIQMAPEHIIPKIPLTQIGVSVALSLKRKGHRVSFTAVTTVSQAYIAAQARADFIIPYYNRLQRAGIDAAERISQFADLFHSQHIPTRILAASIKSPEEAASALLAGAHDLTVTPAVLLDMATDPNSDEAVAKFAEDWQKLNTLS